MRLLSPIWLCTGALVSAACGRQAAVAPEAAPASGRTSCAGREVVDTTFSDTTRVTERPALRRATSPPHPRGAGTGIVVLQFVVNADGTIDRSSIKFVRRVNPALDDAALQTVLGALFWPGCVGSVPVRVLVSFPVTFED